MAEVDTLPVPFEALALPADTRRVRRRESRPGGHKQIAAETDADALKAFLARYADTKTTFENYRKEVERLYLWAVFQLRKPISSLTHEDMLVYERFMADPQPADRVGYRRPAAAPARGHADWRPFQGPLSPSSRRQAMVILNVMFGWLVSAGYLAGNPLSLSRQRQRKAKPRITRYLDPSLWAEVKQYDRSHAAGIGSRTSALLPQLAGCSPCSTSADSESQKSARTRWAAFFCRRDRDGEERWWLEVLGKGEKTRLVPATSELMAELASLPARVRLSVTPFAGEETPLVLPIGKSQKPLTRAALHNIVKTSSREPAELRFRGHEFASRAEQLSRASAHWLRHTAGSHMADGALDLRHVRDNLGHESLKTTSQYLHSDDDKRHVETSRAHKISWAGDQ